MNPTLSLPQLLLFPCNGNALEALACTSGLFAVVGFIDDSVAKVGTTVAGVRVYARTALDEWPDARVLAVPGSPASFRERQQLVESLGVPVDRFATVIHPAATVAPLAQLGHNILIMAGAVITSNAVIGNHVCILPNTVVHHDTNVGSWSLVGSNVTLAGGVQVGENCYVASGTSVRDGVTIGNGALVGMGSVVTRDVPPHARVAGIPARELPRRD